MNFKYIIAFFCILGLPSTFYGLEQVACYEKIGQTIPQVEVSTEKPQEIDHSDPFAIFFTDVEIKPLPTLEKQHLVLDLFSRTLKDRPTNTVLMAPVINELNILCGELGFLNVNLCDIVNRTTTTFGGMVLARMLTEPAADSATPIHRQKFIRALLENEELYNACDQALLSVQDAENHLLTLWSKKNPLDNKQIHDMLFYSWKFCKPLNRSPKLLESMRAALGGLAGGTTLLYIGLAGLNAYIKEYPFAALWTGLGLFNGYKMYQAISGVERFKMATQEFMIHTRSMVEALKDVTSITDSYKLDHHDQLTNFVDQSTTSDNMNNLFDLLKKSTFKGQPSMFSYLGRALVAYNYMEEVKDEFAPALEALGEIDALFSAAKLIKEFEDKPVKFCLVDFVESELPVLNFKDGWNPLIDPSVVVTESMNFGHNGVQNLLLTGPHGSGKSSFMREAMYIALLAQTFGIAPASSCTMTPFKKLNTYLNIKEDYSEGLSTFMAERKRVDQITEIITTLQPGEFALSIMDEVFKGTMEEEGAKRVYRFGKLIAQTPQSICLMATHFNYPTILEENTNGVFVNYHVGLHEHEDGKFTRLFKLIPGKNAWWFNDAEKRDRFIEWLQTVAK